MFSVHELGVGTTLKAIFLISDSAISSSVQSSQVIKPDSALVNSLSIAVSLEPNCSPAPRLKKNRVKGNS